MSMIFALGAGDCLCIVISEARSCTEYRTVHALPSGQRGEENVKEDGERPLFGGRIGGNGGEMGGGIGRRRAGGWKPILFQSFNLSVLQSFSLSRISYLT